MLELFRCERLSANITKAACERNRARKGNLSLNILPLLACVDCPGLGDITEIVEVKEMSTHKAVCKEPGCEKYQVQGGYCWLHAKAHGIDPKSGKKLVSAVAKPKPVKGGGVAAPAVKADPVADIPVKASTEAQPVIDMASTIEAIEATVPQPDPKMDVNEALLVNLGWLVDESFELARQKVIASLSALACPRERIRAALKVAADLDIVAAPPSSLRAIGGMLKDQAAIRA